MKIFLTALFSVSIFSGQLQAAELLPNELPKEATRALLENLSGLPPPIGGPIDEADRLELRKPLTLTIQNGQEFQGSFNELHDGRIYLRMVQDGGEIILSFPVEDIKSIFFPGGDIVHSTIEKVTAGELNDALPYLESIIATRYSLFPILPPEEISYFRALPLAALAVGNPAQAIAYAKAIRPYLTLPEDQRELDDIELLSYFQLELYEEAEERALLWIENSPDRFPESALGYYVLAALHFQAEDFSEALDAALFPVVFSGPIHQPYLSHCYSLAIVSAYLLDDPIESEKLITEMQRRNIDWHPQAIFTTAAKALEEFDLNDSEGNPLLLFPDDSAPDPLVEEAKIVQPES